MLGDRNVTGDRVDTKVYSDVEDDIYTTERDFPEIHNPVRKVNQLVVELGEALGVKTYIVPAPIVCKFSHYFHLSLVFIYST